ncbi:MAG: hypothetical protein AAF490_03245 [Chloroflexota bacterium]
MTALQFRTNNFMEKLNTVWHEKALWAYIVIVLGHFSEHVIQIYQIYILGWLPKEAGGILGLWFPWLAESEILHIAYNGAMWIGILLLWKGVQGQSRTFWKWALIFQTWHLFEHVILMYQFVAKDYWFGGARQTSIGEIFFPRPELHFMYNFIVFVPLMIACFLYFRNLQKQNS